jgi:hypothetical protein
MKESSSKCSSDWAFASSFLARLFFNKMEEVKWIHTIVMICVYSKWVVIDCKIETFASLGLNVAAM